MDEEKEYPTREEISQFFAHDTSLYEKWIVKYDRFFYLRRLLKHNFIVSLKERFEYQDLGRELRDLEKVIRDEYAKDGILRNKTRKEIL